MKRILLASSLLLCAALARADVKGTAVTPDGLPLAGVRVALFAATVPGDDARRLLDGQELEPVVAGVTDSRGNFKLAVAKPGNYMLHLSADGYAPAGISTNGTEDLCGLLMRPAAMKRGSVTSGGKPVANAILYFGPSGRHVTKSAADGSYNVPDPAVWLPTVTVAHPDYATYRQDLGFTGNATVRLDIRMTAGATLRGRVLTPDGKPASKAKLFVDGSPSGESAEDGTFEIRHVPPAWKEMAATSGDLAARVGKSASMTLRLAKAVTLRGKVVDPGSGAGVGGALVWLELSRDSVGIRAGAIADGRGTFSIPALLPGTYFLVATAAGYASTSVDQTITVATPPRTLYASKLTRVSGTISDAQRNPVGAAAVRIAPRSRNVFWSGPASQPVSAPDGRYSAPVTGYSAESGELDVTVTRAGYAATVDGPHTLKPGEEKRVNITLLRGVSLKGRVVNADGEPLAGVAVGTQEMAGQRMYASFRENWSQLPVTDAEGRFDVRLRPGNYNAYFHLAGFAPKKLGDVKVTETAEPLEVTLERAVSISGRVISATGEAMPDMNVFAFTDGPPVHATSDANGSFVLHGLPPLMINVNVSNQDETVAVSRQVKAPAENVTIELTPTVRVSGMVRARGGRSVSDFVVDVVERQRGENYWVGEERPQQVHDADGRFVIEQVTVRACDLTVKAPGHLTARIPLTLEKGKDLTDVEVLLEPAGTVRGRVTNESGAPLERVWVGPEGAGSSRSDAVMTDANGDYVFDRLPLGEATMTFSKRGYQSAKKPVNVEAGDARLDVQLSSGLTMSGRVVSEDGAPVAEAEVFAGSEGTGAGWSNALTDASGRFRLEGLGSGIYRVRAQKRGFMQAEVSGIDLAKTPEVTVKMSAGATVSGHVSGIDVSKFREVRVLAAGVGGAMGPQSDAVVDPSGNFRMDGAPTGKVGIRAVARGGSSRVSELVEIETQSGGTYKVDLEFKEHNTVRGRVSRRGTPLREGHISFTAKVGRGGGSGVIDANGNYEVIGVRSGEQDVIIMDFSDGLRYLTVRSVTQSQALDIDLNPASVSGRVVNDATDEPIADADVVLELPRSEFTWLKPAGKSGTDGRVVIEGIPPGTYDLRVSREGFAAYLSTQTLHEGGVANLQVRLTPSTGLSLRAVDARNGGTVGAHITARTAGGAIAYAGTPRTRPDGAMVLPLAPGSYRLTVNASGLGTTYVNVTSPGSRELTLRPGGTLDVNTPGGTILGRIVQADGSEYNTAEWSTHDASFRILDGTRVTDIAAGRYTLQLLDESGNVTKSQTFEIREGEVTTLSL